MVGGKLKFNGKVSASSILEVIISMVLILIVFTLAMMISANVLRSSLSLKKVSAQAVLNDVLIHVEQTANLESGSFAINDFEIVQQIKPYGDNPGLADVRLMAYDANGQLITEVKKIVIIKNE